MRQCIFRAQGLHGIARREGKGRNIAPANRSHCRIEREAGRIGIEGKNEGQWSARHGQFDDPQVVGGGEAISAAPSCARCTASSPISTAPRSIRARAREDLPDPGGPSISKARPPIATAVTLARTVTAWPGD